LEEECRQATEKLENYREQSRMQRASTDEVLRDVERAKKEFLELKKLHREEQDIREEYQEACRRLLCRELENDLSERCYSAMKLQGESCGEIEKLASYSRLEIKDYDMVLEKRRQNKITERKKIELLQIKFRTAMSRENRIREEFRMSEERRKQWGNDSRLWLEEAELFDSELRRSEERMGRFRYLTVSCVTHGKLKVARAREAVYNTAMALRNELVLAQNQEEMFQKESDKWPERINKLKHELSQVDKRKHWLDQLKSTCDNRVSVSELFQKTCVESDQQKEELKRLLQTEEALFQELRKMHERTKLLKKSLEVASETMMNLQPKILHKSDQFFQTCELIDGNEKSLQEQINKAYARAQRATEETDSALWKEKELQRKVEVLCTDEKCFQIPVMQMKYGESGECCLSFF